MGAKPTVEGWSAYRPVFIASVLLPIAYDLVETLSNLYLRPFVVNWLSNVLPTPSDQLAFLGSFYADDFYSSVIQNLFGFAMIPIVFLFVFYELGTKIQAKPESSYFNLLKYSFFGGFIGYLSGYILTVGIIWAKTGSYFTNEPWFIVIPGIGISLVAEAIVIALFAFTGVYIGYLHSAKKPEQVPVLTANPELSNQGTGGT